MQRAKCFFGFHQWKREGFIYCNQYPDPSIAIVDSCKCCGFQGLVLCAFNIKIVGDPARLAHPGVDIDKVHRKENK